MSYDPRKRTFRETAVTAIESQRKAGQCKTELFFHARKCVKDCDGDLKAAARLFVDRCDEQEEWMLSEEAGQMHTVAVPEVWKQGKSDCKRAMELGVNPCDLKSYHALRNAKTKANDAAKEQDDGPSDDGPNGGQSVRTTRTSREREVDAATTVEEALESGEVLDAKTTEVMPEDLRVIAQLIEPLSELSRRRCVLKMQAIASAAREEHDGSKREGQRRKSKAHG